MPTGYTAGVCDGTVTEFSDFAMQCARAFGACISMRDDPLDATIPDVIAPSSYHVNALISARAELDRIRRMTVDAQTAECAAANAARRDDWKRRQDARAKQRQRYDDMLTKVRAWHPPTKDHVELKRFMEKQLIDSIDFDCGGRCDPQPEDVSRAEWYSSTLAEAKRSVEYHERENDAEVARAKSRTQWLVDLRQSLAR